MISEVRRAELGERFEFGRNWQRFLRVLDDNRIAKAEHSLGVTLERERLSGASFLDVGSGSGLFSLAAIRLGARRVHSFDYDPLSVACERVLKQRYFPAAEQWTIERGDVLDPVYLGGLGQFEIVYSWGVLHHTGRMWEALANVAPLVADGGRLVIAIYNDEGVRSRGWRILKRLYNRSPVARVVMVATAFSHWALAGAAVGLSRRRNPLARYRAYRQARGMSFVHDWLDWLGGYPFEVARPGRIFEFFQARGFDLVGLRTTVGWGNNEYVFVKRDRVARLTAGAACG